MKSAFILPALVAAALLAGGCDKEESAPAQGPDAQQIQNDLRKAAEQAKADVQKVSEKAKTDAEKAKKDLGNALQGLSK